MSLSGSQQKVGKSDEGQLARVMNSGDKNWNCGLQGLWVFTTWRFSLHCHLGALNCVLLINLLVFLTHSPTSFI